MYIQQHISKDNYLYLPTNLEVHCDPKHGAVLIVREIWQ